MSTPSGCQTNCSHHPPTQRLTTIPPRLTPARYGDASCTGGVWATTKMRPNGIHAPPTTSPGTTEWA